MNFSKTRHRAGFVVSVVRYKKRHSTIAFKINSHKLTQGVVAIGLLNRIIENGSEESYSVSLFLFLRGINADLAQ
ncbi:hypothetical protein RA893_004949 [Escherichia coli]|nr:hypothetical protein [Escherichia coli]